MRIHWVPSPSRTGSRLSISLGGIVVTAPRLPPPRGRINDLSPPAGDPRYGAGPNPGSAHNPHRAGTPNGAAGPGAGEGDRGAPGRAQVPAHRPPPHERRPGLGSRLVPRRARRVVGALAIGPQRASQLRRQLRQEAARQGIVYFLVCHPPDIRAAGAVPPDGRTTCTATS